METLLALAIMSVASLALFQSTTTLLRLSERTINAAQRAQDAAVMQKSFIGLVEGIVPGWPKDKADVFTGDRAGFSSLTRAPLHTLEPALRRFALVLESDGRSSSLIYQSGDTRWVLKAFPYPQATFSYLGENNLWYPAWPLAQTPEAGEFDDAKFIDPPALPLAIRLEVGASTQDAKTVWIAYIGAREKLPDLKEF